MPLPEGLSARTAHLRDVPAILELRRAVGWAAHEWALRLAIEPDSARCIVVEGASGELVAVGSGVAYPPIGIVGNMIVAKEHRRRGLGRFVLESVVAFLEERGCTRLELFATDQGRPLYARYGFEHIALGSRLRLTRDLVRPDGADAAVDVVDGTPGILEELAAYDASRFGGPRRALLAAMLADTARSALVAWRGPALAGFGWLRPDDDRIGPWVADDADAAAAILAEAFRRLPDRHELTANLPMTNETALRWVRAHGIEPDPWDGRMARGPTVPRREDAIYGNTMGALG